MSIHSTVHPAHQPCASYLWLVIFLAPIVTGVLAPLCFPPYKIWPLVWVVLMPFDPLLDARAMATAASLTDLAVLFF